MPADAGRAMCDSDDDQPLIRPELEQAAQERQPSVQAGSASGSSLNSTATPPGVWSKSFCFQYYGQRGRFQPSSAVFVPAARGKPTKYEVRRNISDVPGGNIRIPVRVAEHRMFYIVYKKKPDHS